MGAEERGRERRDEERRRGGEEEGRRVVVDALRNERPIRRSPRVEGTSPPCGRHVDATWVSRESHATRPSAERLGWALVYLNPISRPISRIGRLSRTLPTPQTLTSVLSLSLSPSRHPPPRRVWFTARVCLSLFPLPFSSSLDLRLVWFTARVCVFWPLWCAQRRTWCDRPADQW